MHNRTATGQAGRETALARQREILALFQTIKRTLAKQILAFEAGDGGTPKALVAKLGELSAAHLALLKAEDAFCEKFCEDDTRVPDYEALRAQIGRKLDRIRDTRPAEGVPRTAE
ncbi:hypothetical protein [Salipiger sp. IMCC34102]|uniref:hypothetical protein n=1 Tax=Salipiger sp. IMCC34102 TaxID=2510647 RepID=UPI001F5CD051|nr:hypothetical protein [Salipiger sp. IMCC34102]